MTLTFVGVTLRKVERETASGKLHMSAELTPAIRKAFEWGEAQSDKARAAKMEGEIAGGSLVLTPKEMGMRGAQFPCEFGSLDHLEIVRLESENSRGKGHRYEVRFEVKFSGTDTAARAERWLTKIGDAKGTLTVTFAKQETLDLAEKPEKQGKLKDVQDPAS